MSSLQTPRQRGLQRPSISPGLSSVVARKSSQRVSAGLNDPKTPAGAITDGDFEVGDQVTVPGDMYGVVKFVGSVKGKPGRFVGVELDRDFAARGKNDGDVDGTQYFRTSVPGAGIFLPVHRAERRATPAKSQESSPMVPNTPSYTTTTAGHRTRGDDAAPVLPSQFSKTLGPGVRPSSPTFKPSRPSLPRPESPFRKQPPPLAPTPGAKLAQSTRGPRPGMTPSRTNLKSSTSMRQGSVSTTTTSRPYSRTGSRVGSRDEEQNKRTIGAASVSTYPQPSRSPSRLGSAGGQEEVQRLKQLLTERDKRLEEQAGNLADMEQSVKELSALLPQDGGGKHGALDGNDDHTAAQLRQLLREKNEKISVLTSEFDVHRADFRSTLDSLEMASTETERVYEEQKRDLLAQVAELQEMTQSKEDFEGVARQLKQLEEFVAELEEGLEESRRGEAEARGEVEFLRGEVERGRSELRREREKAASVLNGSDSSSGASKATDQKDHEIRGLKAILHSMSSTPNATPTDETGGVGNAEHVRELQSELEHSRKEKEALERQIEQLRRDSATTNGNGAATHARHESERTATGLDYGIPSRARSGTVKPTYAQHAERAGMEDPLPTGDGRAATETTAVYCDMCESASHDTLECTKVGNRVVGSTKPSASLGKENDQSARAKADEDKWCALCEKDGHLAFECPEEQY